MGLPADERTAYWLGLGDPDAVRMPTPVILVVALLLSQFVAEEVLRERGLRREKLGVMVVSLAIAFVGDRVSERARRRRAQSLGLTAETAPLSASPGLTVRLTVVRVVLVCLQHLGVRRRSGRWVPVSTSSIIAAGAIRELQLRRDWNTAYRAR